MSNPKMNLILDGLHRGAINESSTEVMDREKDSKALQTYIEVQLKKLLTYSKRVTRYFRDDRTEITFNLDKWESKHLRSGATLKKWLKESGIDVKDAKVTASKEKFLTGWSSDSADGSTYKLVIEYNS